MEEKNFCSYYKDPSQEVSGVITKHDDQTLNRQRRHYIPMW